MQLIGRNHPTQNIETIRKEYQRLDLQWMHLQYDTNRWCVCFTTAMEIVMFFILLKLHAIHTTAACYFWKYVLVPLVSNLLLLVISHYAVTADRFHDSTRIYIVSVVMTFSCFIYYTVHCMFSSLYLIFAIPMFFTVVYADIKLTGLIFSLCVIEKVVADLIIQWDSDKINVFSSKAKIVDFFLSLMLLAVLYVVCRVIIWIEQKKNNFSIELEQEREKMEVQAVTDTLTGIGNRKALREAFEQLKNNPQRQCVLVMVDLDHFKELNDLHGHTCGDQYLEALGSALQNVCGRETFPYRFGGDEFCIMLWDTDPSDVLKFCQALQKKFRILQEELIDGVFTTLSIGIANYRSGEQPIQLLKRADKALYQAKEQRDHDGLGGHIDYALYTPS